MNIQTHLFVLFFLPLVLLLWRLFRNLHPAAPQLCLLLAGLLFCGWASPPSLLVLAGEGMLSYLLGLSMLRSHDHRLPALFCGVALLLGVLALFKYSPLPLPGWLAPLGLSFLSFQQILWLHDCYYEEASPISPLDYACCISFFPTATCGPITRISQLAPALRNPRPFSWDDLSAGLYCFALGLAKKTLLSALFANGANYGYAHAASLPPADALLTILCYTLQIYFDFSGYCDMAAGIARMLGVSLPVNFNSPYQAVSIKEFWGRWHVSLSRFFRICVYIPLGGNRRGNLITYRNILLVFLLSGIWHGAGWGFLLWGALHGLAMVLHRMLPDSLQPPRPIGWLLTFLFVNFAWVFFRADNLQQAFDLLGCLFQSSWALPSQDFAAALPLSVLKKGFSYLQYRLMPGGNLLTYWLPLSALPLGCALLALPNPLVQAESFQPSVPKALLAVLALCLSVLFFSGVDTFIYANF